MNDDIRTSMSAIPYDPASRPLGVLIGYDGSEQSVLALHYAARAALRAGSRLTVVSAFTVPTMLYTTAAAIPPVPEDVAREAAAREVLEEARDRLAGYPGQIELRAEQGDAAGVLVRLSADARLAVVGARGRGGFLGRLLGSVSSALPSHAHCPTVVVPTQYVIGEGTGAERFARVDDDAPVVAGTDRSPQGALATRFAAQAAMDRLAPLHLTLALPPMESLGGWYPEMVLDPRVVEQRHQQLEESLAEDAEHLRQEFPALQVTTEVLVGDPIAQLVEHSRTAQLVVVGTRGHGRMASALLGSVSRGLLQRAEGPVLVVPDLSTPTGKSPHRPR
ncbi:universal stress protein [Brachybacterium sp. YJGR34]|uniref:universal stress protein n=1 Tax=Brachybacterium sp. YJGR34 TaxID=2059911 RepID=UPI000E0A43AA|nr:universal stress protein [Brachybacterium sp. YJGR34]